jgi:hypothetical protein
MGLYNGAAWLRRRQRHLAVNAVIYLALTIWEQRHVAHHLATCIKADGQPPADDKNPISDGKPPVDDELKVA